MFVILLLGLLGGLTEGAVLWRRQVFGNGSYPGQEIGNQINQQFGSQFQPPPQIGGFVPPNFQQFQQGGGGGGGQQQQQQRLEGQPDSTQIPIVKLDIQPNLGDGKYQYSYETGNGIKAEESGSQKAVGEPAELGTAAVGSYSYTDPQGNLISLTYTADENGFVPKGAHLPEAPPIPPEILAALEKNAAEEAAQNSGAISPSYQYFFKTAYNTRHRYY